jgi:hypothetical protein
MALCFPKSSKLITRHVLYKTISPGSILDAPISAMVEVDPIIWAKFRQSLDDVAG